MNSIYLNKSYRFFQTNNILPINNSLYNIKMNCSACKIQLFDNVKILFGVSELYCKTCFKKYFITKSEILESYRLLKPYLKKILRWKNSRRHHIYIKLYILRIYKFLKYKNYAKI